MKEYICKEDLADKYNSLMLVNPEDASMIIDMILGLSTVTKADICHELCENIIHSLQNLANCCKEAGDDANIKGFDYLAAKYYAKQEAYLSSIEVIKAKCKLAEIEGTPKPTKR